MLRNKRKNNSDSRVSEEVLQDYVTVAVAIAI